MYKRQVDEYQDTNHIQERMLELLSNGHNRFMVGDIKQSIYRFRQADPQIFKMCIRDSLCADFHDYFKKLSQDCPNVKKRYLDFKIEVFFVFYTQ